MKVLITRPRAQSDSFADALRAAGFEPVFFPVIEIRPFEENIALDRALAKLGCYDWIVFTSVNGVDAFFERLPSPFPQIAKGIRVAAIGPKTAQSLETRGVRPDFVPAEFVAEAILPGLGDLRGRWVLLPRAETARKALPDAITAAGGVPHEIAVYRTVPTEPDPLGLASLRSGVDVITFTSPSTVVNFVRVVQSSGLDPLHLPNAPLVICIGPITRQAANEAGFPSALVADEYTTEGLLAVVRQIQR